VKRQVNVLLSSEAAEKLRNNAAASGLSASDYVAALLHEHTADIEVKPPAPEPSIKALVIKRLEQLGGRASLTALMAPWRGKMPAADFRRDVDGLVAEGMLAVTVVHGPRGRPATIIHWPELSAMPDHVPPAAINVEVAP
jgi:hypothetical protein